MLEHMKKPPIDLFRVICPAEKTHDIKEYLARQGCIVDDDSCDATAILPPLTPRTVLSGARYRESLTQKQLSDLTGISRRHLSEMEQGKRPIGHGHAELLGKVLNVEPRRFLSH